MMMTILEISAEKVMGSLILNDHLTADLVMSAQDMILLNFHRVPQWISIVKYP